LLLELGNFFKFANHITDHHSTQFCCKNVFCLKYSKRRSQLRYLTCIFVAGQLFLGASNSPSFTQRG